MRIVIAGGGTGGHLFPGIAIAEEFIKRNAQTKVVFIGTKRGIESRLLSRLGYDLETIDIEASRDGDQGIGEKCFPDSKKFVAGQRKF
jgi:UDP-N-acetylglucosamine:LPS N-acetylglucosamine transferase